ncbi:MAG TPA: hypothetical protein VKT82_16390 [Ktedonobacterales bacterium]|nr:hypothetical protein [Ktedonobacterales bacterium]
MATRKNWLITLALVTVTLLVLLLAACHTPCDAGCPGNGPPPPLHTITVPTQFPTCPPDTCTVP